MDPTPGFGRITLQQSGEHLQVLSPFYEHEWGPLLWWAIALHDEHERGAAEALLTRGGIQLSFTAKNHDADELLITCWEPGPGPSALTACLRFNLRDAVHACELLLLARRQSVAVDFLTEHIDEWDDREIQLIGTTARGGLAVNVIEC
ncbi:hypothetical protein [Streptomyces goshikiensis]|uniref:hypothetical protein n=1 Tax=Streptomyces goshikiensis TaxID=1942 RepID=UPI0036A36A50